ncbi:hypothetical protein Tco_1104656 [Tanacetum coccineum]
MFLCSVRRSIRVKGSGVGRVGVGSSDVVSGEVVCVFVVEVMVVDVEDDGGVIASSCWVSRWRPEMKQLSKAFEESPSTQLLQRSNFVWFLEGIGGGFKDLLKVSLKENKAFARSGGSHSGGICNKNESTNLIVTT